MAWSDGISPESPAYAIAASTNSRVRVIAGPGTGKSFAMKRRVARLLEEGVAPTAILPVTFTRVAAEDLHRELVGMGVQGCDQLEGVTLHSLAMRLLMRNHVLTSTGRTPRPLGQFELSPLFADLKAVHGGLRELRKKKEAYEAAWARLQHQLPGYAPTPSDKAFQADLLAWLRFHKSMLIGEVIPLLYVYLASNPAAPERSEFAHILVDEFQDLNRAEQGVVALLSNLAHVCVVGDDDQAIYTFKHAHPEGIREWLTVNQGAADLGLDDCRRCPTRVVAMANSLIGHNASRPVPRLLKPLGSNGIGEVRVIQYANLQDEVLGVASLVQTLVQGGVPPGDILVLAQRAEIGTPIYEAIVAQSIPVRSYYAESELDSDDAQLAMALLRLLAHREDRVALRWLLGRGGSNWNAAGYRRIRVFCESSGVTPWDALNQLRSGTISIPGSGSLLKAFNAIAEAITALEALPDLESVIDFLFPADQEAVRDIRALSLSVLAEESPESAAKLLQGLNEAINQPEIPDAVTDVRIMSLHKSKGLSSPVTVIAGCIEGLLPRQPKPTLPQADQDREIEEQRRLFFVGITRVKALPSQGKPGTLVLTYSRKMPAGDAKKAGIVPAAQNYGVAQLNASRFIAELGPSCPTPVAG